MPKKPVHNLDISAQSNNEKRYIEGTTFEDIFIQYSLDRTFSRILIPDLLNIEQKLKTVLGHVVAKNFGVYHQIRSNVPGKPIVLTPSSWTIDLYPTSYLDKRNYDTNNNPYSNVEALFEVISDTKRDPLAYYRDNRSHIPPWILFDTVEFGKLNRYFKSLKSDTKIEVITQFLEAKNLTVDTDAYLYQNFFGFMELIRQYRNAFAHSSRFIASKFTDNSLSKKFRDYLGTPELFTNAEYKSGIGKGDLFSLLILLTVFSDDKWAAKGRIDYYQKSLNKPFEDIETKLPASSDKARKAFMASSGLPDDYADRLTKLTHNIF